MLAQGAKAAVEFGMARPDGLKLGKADEKCLAASTALKLSVRRPAVRIGPPPNQAPARIRWQIDNSPPEGTSTPKLPSATPNMPAGSSST